MSKNVRYYLGDENDLRGMTREEVESVTSDEYGIDDAYEAMLNEHCEPVSIAGLTYDAGYALRNVDPVAFRCGASDVLVEVDLDDYPEY